MTRKKRLHLGMQMLMYPDDDLPSVYRHLLVLLSACLFFQPFGFGFVEVEVGVGVGEDWRHEKGMAVAVAEFVAAVSCTYGQSNMTISNGIYVANLCCFDHYGGSFVP